MKDTYLVPITLICASTLLLGGCTDSPSLKNIGECELIILSNNRALEDNLLTNEIAKSCMFSKGYVWDLYKKHCADAPLRRFDCYVEDNLYTKYVRGIFD